MASYEMGAARQPLSLQSSGQRRSRAKACIAGLLSGMDARDFNTFAAHAGMIGANAAFGAFNVWTKTVIVDSYDDDGNCVCGMKPVIFGLYRDVAVLPLLVFWATITGGWRRITNCNDAGNMLLLGFSGIGLFQACHLIGLQWVGSGIASCYNPLSAIFSAAFAVFPWRYERPSWRKVIGSLVGLAGMLIVVRRTGELTTDPTDDGSLSHYIQGNVWCLFGALTGSLSFLLQKPLLRKYSSRMTLAVAYVPAVIVLALFSVRPVIIGTNDTVCQKQCSRWEVRRDQVLPLAISVLVSGAGFLTMLWANKFLDASISASYCVVQPLAAELAKTLTQHELPFFGDFVGYLVLLLALVAVSSKNDAGSDYLA